MIIVSIIVAVLGSCYLYNYLQITSEIETIIYDLYAHNFYDMYKVEDGYKLEIDKEKLNEIFEEKCKIFYVSDDNIHFIVKYKIVFNHQKEYYFYLEKNYE